MGWEKCGVLGPGLSVSTEQLSWIADQSWLHYKEVFRPQESFIHWFLFPFFKEYIGIFVLVAYSSGIPREFVPRDMFPFPYPSCYTGYLIFSSSIVLSQWKEVKRVEEMLVRQLGSEDESHIRDQRWQTKA